jgi:hypothetical protein
MKKRQWSLKNSLTLFYSLLSSLDLTFETPK